jgi:hypothetical protein
MIHDIFLPPYMQMHGKRTVLEQGASSAVPAFASSIDSTRARQIGSAKTGNDWNW